MHKANKHIHVIAFDVPYPADYGGVIDIYYKLVAMHELGVHVHLHCYHYGRQASEMLKTVCDTIHYYRRKVFKNPIYNAKPYIVATRNSTELIENLLKDDYPILFEGLHSTYYLADDRLRNRYKIVRTHNIEHLYYKHLEKVESHVFKRYFFKVESTRLKRYEKVLKHANLIAAISQNDADYFNRKYGHTLYVPPFHVNAQVTSKEGTGDFILYHGNLSVGENNEAAMYLLEHVIGDMNIPTVIAGSNPSLELVRMCQQMAHVTLKSNVTSEEINHLIADAQINLLFTKQATGIKLKLINALYMGRHCVVNKKMVLDTGVEDLCRIANTSKQLKMALLKAWDEPFESVDILHRKSILEEEFNNKTAIIPLLEQVFGGVEIEVK